MLATPDTAANRISAVSDPRPTAVARYRLELRRRMAARTGDVVPLLAVLVAVLVANGPALLHLVTSNPLVLDANLVIPGKSGRLPGVLYADPNAGYTTQALGHLAALDWLHGHIPWWNPFEGVGAPLAGEMQSGAFFPLTLALALHQGMLIMQILIESITGWATYLLLRRLGIGRTIATAGGVAFGLCGTFAWFAHAPIRPVMLLPVCLLGVEHALSAASQGRRGGWQLLAVAIALSVVAGFPETAFLDGLLVGWWALFRLTGDGRRCWRPLATKLGAGLAVGGALSAPLVVAFADYLPYADVGGHTGALAHGSLVSESLPQLVLPYSLGPVFGFRSTAAGPDIFNDIWGNAGGFLTVTIIAGALVGLVGRRQRWLRVGLGTWVLISLLRVYGYPPLVHTLSSLPGLRLTAFYRYSDPSWELAVVVLAALGLDDVCRRATRRTALVAGAVVAGGLAVWAAVTAWPLLDHVMAPGHPSAHSHDYPVASLAGAVVVLVTLVAGGLVAGHRAGAGDRRPDADRSRRWGRIVMALAVGGESVLLFGFTYLSAPTPTPLQTGSVAWLQTHLGAHRFVTLGPIQPDYGSYFGIAQANINDLPMPSGWADFVDRRLDPNTDPSGFTGQARKDPAGPTPAQELTMHEGAYESVGVAYVVEDANGRDIQGKPFPAVGAPAWPAGPRLVYRDSFAEVWQLPNAAPAFSLAAVGGAPSSTIAECSVTGSGWDRATVRCAHPTALVRRVQYLPGWTATGPGFTRRVVRDGTAPGKLFQQVDLPAGTSTVRFTYLPPRENLGIGLAVAAGLVLLISLVFALVADVRRSQPRPLHARARTRD